MAKRGLTRREFLLGMGAAGAGAGLCACSAAALLAGFAVRGNRERQQTTLTQTVPPVTRQPDFPVPEIIPRWEWGALPPDHTALNEFGFYPDNPTGWRIYEGDLHDAYQTVVIHHSAFYEEDDLQTLLEIQRAHREDRLWADVAYHFLVGANGAIYEGRDRYVRGTHVERYNSGSLGICLLGNFVVAMPADAQLASAQRLIVWAAHRFQLTHIAAHRDFNPRTECPGDRLYRVLGSFAQAASLQMGIDGYLQPELGSVPCPCCTVS